LTKVSIDVEGRNAGKLEVTGDELVFKTQQGKKVFDLCLPNVKDVQKNSDKCDLVLTFEQVLRTMHFSAAYHNSVLCLRDSTTYAGRQAFLCVLPCVWNKAELMEAMPCSAGCYVWGCGCTTIRL
jgi:hypothetical protein